LDNDEQKIFAGIIKETAETQKTILQRLDKIERHLGITTNYEKPKPVQQNISPIMDKKPLSHNKPAPENVPASIPVKTPVTKTVKENPATESLEFTIGGTWLNRLGAVAVILGLSYFLKYSFDNQWIGPTGRIILGIIAGLALLGAGEKLRKKYSVYSQGLIGAGSLALFFSVYAGFSFYQLISPPIAFIFLVIVMANTVFTSVRHDSLPIGVLGIIGGYATPFLVGSNDPSPWILFSYLFVLTGGILGVSVYKRWNSFRLISFVLNQAIIAIWMFTTYQDAYFAPTLLFTVLNFFSYLAIATGYKLKNKENVNEPEIALIGINALAFFWWSRELLSHTFIKEYMGFYALFLAVMYIFLGRLAYQLYKEDKKQVYTLFAIAIVLVTIAIPLQLSEKYIPFGWLLEAAGLFFIAGRLKIYPVLITGLIVLVLGTISAPVCIAERYIPVTWMGEALGFFLMGKYLDMPELRISAVAALFLGASGIFFFDGIPDLINSQKFLVNWPSFDLLLSIGLAWLMYFLYSKIKRSYEENYLRAGLGVGVLALIFIFITLQNSHFFTFYTVSFFNLSPEQLSLSLLWLTYAVVLFLTGLKRDIKELRYAALGLVGIVLVKAFFVDLANLATIFKILLFIILGLCLLGISFIYQKKRHLIDKGAAK